MSLFDPESPLLKNFDAAATNAGFKIYGCTSRDEFEQRFYSRQCSSYHRLSYSGDLLGWEREDLHGAKEAERELVVAASADGDLRLYQGHGEPYDDEIPLFQTTLLAGVEFSEIMEFYTSVHVKDLNTALTTRKTLSDLIEGVYLLIPDENTPGIIPLLGHKLQKEHPDIAEIVDVFLEVDWDRQWDRKLQLRSKYGEWPAQHARLKGLGSLQPLKDDDLIFHGNCRALYAGMQMRIDTDHYQNFHALVFPALVIRPKECLSRIWWIDFLEHASESEGLIKRICSGWQHLPKGLDRISVNIPRSKLDQIGVAIEARTARSAYLETLKSSMQMREPFGQLAATYRKRTRAARGLHTELLDDLEALQQPLPFFLEYPYRLFRREDDHIRKIRAGQRLLGILAKVPLYLVIEELLAAKHPLGKEVMDKLRKSPPSDGTLASLQKELAGKLSAEADFSLPVFNCLLKSLAANEYLLKIVAARNRMHHEPYDEDGFLEMVSENAPRIMDSLRTALKDVRFVVPTHVKSVEGEMILTAEDTCNSEAHFRSVDLQVSLPLEAFPSGKLIAWRKFQECSIALGSLVTAKMITQQSRDFGIFDRMEKNEPHFTFLRSD